MRGSTPDAGHRHSELFASLAVEWVRQTRVYARSVALFQERASRRDGRHPRTRRQSGLVAAFGAVHLPVVVVPLAEPAGGAPAPVRPSARVEQREPARCSPLTARQTEIAALIADGLTNEQIAERLVLTPGTVGNHIGHILRRLGASNRAQVAAWLTRQAAGDQPPPPTERRPTLVG